MRCHAKQSLTRKRFGPSEELSTKQVSPGQGKSVVAAIGALSSPCSRLECGVECDCVAG